LPVADLRYQDNCFQMTNRRARRVRIRDNRGGAARTGRAIRRRMKPQRNPYPAPTRKRKSTFSTPMRMLRAVRDVQKKRFALVKNWGRLERRSRRRRRKSSTFITHFDRQARSMNQAYRSNYLQFFWRPPCRSRAVLNGDASLSPSLGFHP
jgi:hypothetical protein